MSYIGYSASSSDTAIKAREIMERKMGIGRQSALKVLEHVNTHVPNDAIATGEALEFAPRDGSGLSLSLRNQPSRDLHPHALRQAAYKAGVPGAFITDLASAVEPWRRDMAADILNRHFHESQAVERDSLPGKRFLVRAVQNQSRAILSDRFRRLDSRPLVETFAKGCASIGAVPVDGVVSDLRLALKAFLPIVFEPIPGEVMCLGIEWGNSDFGTAKHSLRAYILRLTCLNGATMEDSLAQVHLGGRLADNVEFSEKTYQLDTATQASAMGDLIQNVLGPKHVDLLLATIKSAGEKQINWKGAKSAIEKRLLKSELQLVQDAFESQDVINLPAGNSVWRMSNAISWIAGKTVDQDRSLELQRLAGEVLNGKRDVSIAAEAA